MPIKTSYKLTIIGFLLLTVLTGAAQTGKLFTTDRELSSSMVNDVYQDHDGIIWIATEDGLNRYDGARFTTFRNEPNNASSLSSNYVNSVFEDSQGHFFVSTMDGLCLFDRSRNIFKRIPLVSRNYFTIRANVQMVIQRHNGELFVAVSGYSGLYSITIEGDSIRTQHFTPKPPSGILNLVYEDSRCNLWVSVKGYGLFRYDGKRWIAADGLPQKDIQTMCEDSRGRLYAGSITDGLFVQDKPRDSFRMIDNGLNMPFPIISLMPLSTNKILIGTDGYGLKTYNHATNRMEPVTVNTFDISTDQMKVHSIMHDKNGDLWLGLYQKGVLLLPKHTNGFKLIGWRSTSHKLKSSACIMSVIRTRNGITLIGTDGDGIYAITPQGVVRHFSHIEGGSNSVPAIVTSLFEDSHGTIYVGSYLQGMARLDPTTGHCQYITELKNKQGQPVASVNSFAEDKHRRLWIGSNGDGLFCLDFATGKITDWSTLQGEGNQIYNRWINTVLVASDGRVYVGSYGGSSCLDPIHKNWNTFNNKNRILPDKVVYALYEDTQHNIWAGTATGLVRMNVKDVSTKTITMADGLPSNMVTAILPDLRGNLWLSTSHGLSKFNMRTMMFVNYYTDDGIQGNEFSKNAAFADTELFFGGTNGVTQFQPKTISEPRRNPQIRIAAMYIHDQCVTLGMKSGIFKITNEDVTKSHNFSLAHNDNSFSIEFTAMEFYNPMRISYSYSINDRPWTQLAPGVNRLSFSNLPPGKYHFRVRSCDASLYSKPLAFTITIHPAWYASTIAYIIYVILLIVATFMVYRHIRRKHQIEQEVREHAFQEKVKEDKLQFFINVSHEIRTPMQLIISPLQKLIATDNNSERQGQYSLIMRNARRILRLINQLMDMRKLDKGQMKLYFRKTDMNSFVADICKAFEYQMQQKAITFNFKQNSTGITAWIDPANFDKIIINLLSNALRFTPKGGTITVILTTTENTDSNAECTANDTNNKMNQFFELSVVDSGIGIEPDKMNHIFERFYQINNKITANTTGTGIGLNLAQQLVKLHHGTITVKNNTPEKGCTFTVRIPLGHAHINDKDLVEGEIVTTSQQSNNVATFFENTVTNEIKTTAKSKTHYKVLFAEDEVDIREYITHELSSEYHVTACADGQQAWDMIRRETFDILISDIMMPGIDGLTLCRKVKQNIHTNTTPVILLTAKTLEKEKIMGLDIGADAYITKPVTMELLKTTINNLLRNRSMLKTSFEGKQEQTIDISTMQEESPNDKLMRRIMKVINENINNPTLNVDMISREVGISRVHLYRKLKEITNQSARELLRNVRLKHAAELLKLGNSNVSRIADLTGFSSIAAFSHAFKELYGMSPTEYANNNDTNQHS